MFLGGCWVSQEPQGVFPPPCLARAYSLACDVEASVEAAAPGGHARSRGGHGGGGSSCLACVAACRGDGRSAARGGRGTVSCSLMDVAPNQPARHPETPISQRQPCRWWAAVLDKQKKTAVLRRCAPLHRMGSGLWARRRVGCGPSGAAPPGARRTARALRLRAAPVAAVAGAQRRADALAVADGGGQPGSLKGGTGAAGPPRAMA